MQSKSCGECGIDFLLDTSMRCWWSKKFCDEDCRVKHQSRIRCQRAKTKTKSDRVVKTKVILTDEQRQANEMLRRQRSADSRREQKRTSEQRARIANGIKMAWDTGKYANANMSCSPETKKKISEGLILAYKEGRADLTGYYKNKWHMYEGQNGSIKMRSKSETLFAQYLDSIGVQWMFEPERFDLGWATYTPDFYLPEFDHWIEVKGAWSEVSRQKFDEFSEIRSATAIFAKDILEGKFAEITALGSKLSMSMPSEVGV